MVVSNSWVYRGLSQGLGSPFARPWQGSVPRLGQSSVLSVQFPTEDDSSGSVLVGHRGPKVMDRYTVNALAVTLDYLTDSPVSPLKRELVECPDPFCSDISHDIFEFSETCFYIRAKSVPLKKLPVIAEMMRGVIEGISHRKEPLDMKRMATIIHRQILDSKEKLEDSPHYTFADAVIEDFLYSQGSEGLKERLNSIEHLQRLSSEPEEFWIDFIARYFVSSPCIVVSIRRSHLI